jgi:hypothetical protein
LKYQGETPWTINIYLILKNEGQEGKINLFSGVGTNARGGGIGKVK